MSAASVAPRQILGVPLEQYRPWVAIVRPPEWIRKIVRVSLSYWRFSERNFTLEFCTFLTPSFVPLQRFKVSTLQRFNASILPLGYSSLLGQCLRLVSHAPRALPDLRLRAFHRRSSLPSLCYRIRANSVAAHETPAANNYGRGGIKRSPLLDLLSLTKRH